MSGIISLLLSVATAGLTLSSDTIPHTPAIHKLEITSGYDYMATSVDDEIRDRIPEDERITRHSSFPVNIKYSFLLTNPKVRNYYRDGYQGIGVGFLNIGGGEPGGVASASKHIGYPVSAYVFQGGPFWRPSKRVNFNYEWNFGASFGWKPYDRFTNNNFNLVVGSRVNAYLNLSMLMIWKITDKFSLSGGIALSHYSNGNTSWPNPGVNSWGVRLGASYTFNPMKKELPLPEPDTVARRKMEYDITLWGALRKRVYLGGEKPILLNGHYTCAGVSFAPMVRLNTWWRAGGGLDIQWDESSDLKKNYSSGTRPDDIKFYRPSFGRQLSFGLSCHGELQMPIFAVNVGIGYNLYAPEENRGSYQNITLKTYFSRKIFLNVGYQLRNFRQQAHLMLGMGVTI